MHALITTLEVAQYLKIVDTHKLIPHIEAAHALVASEIGVHTLAEREVEDYFDTYYDRELIRVSDGPIASVESVTIGEESVDLATLKIGQWTIRRRRELWLASSEITVNFTAGYRGQDDSVGENTPAAIKQALIVTAAQLYQVPDASLTYEQIGDYSRKREVRSGGAAVVSEVRQMLRQYKRPSL